MSKVYQGNTPELYELFLKGTELQYQIEPTDDWRSMPVYNGKFDDIYRVSNSNYNFRVKPNEVIIKLYTYCDNIERTMERGDDLNKMKPQIWYDEQDNIHKNTSKCIEYVFTNNKLTAVSILGED